VCPRLGPCVVLAADFMKPGAGLRTGYMQNPHNVMH
jgi:hypothetical protein